MPSRNVSAAGLSQAREFLALQLSAADEGIRLRQLCVMDHTSSAEAHIHAMVHFSDGSSSQWIRLDLRPEELRAAGAEVGYRVNWHLHLPPPSKGLPQSLITELRACAATLTAAEAEVLQAEACPVCLNEYAEGALVLSLPCDASHKVHFQCIQPWLKAQNTCPTCRFELPTDAGSSEIPKLLEASRAGMERLRAEARAGRACGPCDESDPDCVCCPATPASGGNLAEDTPPQESRRPGGFWGLSALKRGKRPISLR